jgi:hypothetical protein
VFILGFQLRQLLRLRGKLFGLYCKRLLLRTERLLVALQFGDVRCARVITELIFISSFLQCYCRLMSVRTILVEELRKSTTEIRRYAVSTLSS